MFLYKKKWILIFTALRDLSLIMVLSTLVFRPGRWIWSGLESTRVKTPIRPTETLTAAVLFLVVRARPTHGRLWTVHRRSEIRWTDAVVRF